MRSIPGLAGVGAARRALVEVGEMGVAEAAVAAFGDARRARPLVEIGDQRRRSSSSKT